MIEPTRERPTINDGRYDITLDQIRKYQKDSSVVIIDARSPHLYQSGHLRGAINLPAGNQKENIAYMHEQVSPEQFVVVYCSSASCEAGDMVYEYLKEEGYKNIRVYKPGWEKLASANIDKAARGS